jgi:hypothetical protein
MQYFTDKPLNKYHNLHEYNGKIDKVWYDTSKASNTNKGSEKAVIWNYKDY